MFYTLNPDSVDKLLVLPHSDSDSSSLVHYWEHQHCLLGMMDCQIPRLRPKGIAPGALLCHPTSNPLRVHLHIGKSYEFLYKHARDRSLALKPPILEESLVHLTELSPLEGEEPVVR